MSLEEDDRETVVISSSTASSNVGDVVHLQDSGDSNESHNDLLRQTRQEGSEQGPSKMDLGSEPPWTSLSDLSFSFDRHPIMTNRAGFDHCTRGCKWSPDGLCVLTNSEDNRLRIFDLPISERDDDSRPEFAPSVIMQEGEMIYDFAWYPRMDSNVPETCFIVTTAQYHPIHLFDAFDGHIRATYRYTV